VEAARGVSGLAVPASWPMRFGGAYLLAWLFVRHIAGRTPRHAWIVFFVAGLVVLNNLEFGMAATTATVTAWVCAQPPRSARDAGRLAASAGAGALGAVVLVSLFTL